MSMPDEAITPVKTTLTIEYTDAQGLVQRSEQLQGSHFTLRVREDALSISDAAVPETASANAPQRAGWRRIQAWTWALILYGLFALLTALDLWIEHNPDNSTQNHVTLALGITAAIALWSAFWALLGKIFAKHALYWQHVCWVLLSGIVLGLLLAAMHFLSFSLSWRALGRMDNITSVAALALLIWAHLSLIVPAHRKIGLRIGMISLLVVGVGLMLWTNHRRQGTLLDTLHAPHLYRPALQLSSAQPAAAFFEQAQSLETSLKAKAGETEPGEDGSAADED